MDEPIGSAVRRSLIEIELGIEVELRKGEVGKPVRIGTGFTLRGALRGKASVCECSSQEVPPPIDASFSETAHTVRSYC